MFRLISRLLGMEWEDIEYDRDMLIFIIVGAAIFLLLGIYHTDKGTKLLYTNRLSVALMSKAEKKGISDKVLEDAVFNYKEAIPINVREYELYEIKGRLENYIGKLKSENNDSLNEVIATLEEINEEDNKEELLNKLEKADLENMLKKVNKKEIARESLMKASKEQSSLFLSNAYLIIGALLSFYAIIVKVIFDIDLIQDKSKNKYIYKSS